MKPWTETDADETTTTGPDLRALFVRGVARSWPWIVILAAIGASAGLVAGVVQHDSFSSKGKLLLRVGARESITSESIAVGDENERATAPTMIDEVQMLSDEAIFERVVRRIGPQAVLDPAAPVPLTDPVLVGGAAKEAAREARIEQAEDPLSRLKRNVFAFVQDGVREVKRRWLAKEHACPGKECEDCIRLATRELVENTKLGSEPGSNVITVETTSTSPAKAQAMVMALADAFVERHHEQFSVLALVDTERAKVEQAKQARDEAANAYVQHVDQSNYAELEPRVPILQTEVTAIEKELFDAKMRQKAIAKQRDRLAGRLDETPAAVVEVAAPAVMIPNEEFETQLMLRRELNTKKIELTQETLPIAERQRRAQALDAQIAEVDRKLKTIPKTIAQNAELRERENTGHVTLSTRVEDLDLEDQELAVKVEALQGRLDEKSNELRDVRRQVLVETTKRKDLESVRDAHDASYKALLGRFSQLEALGNVDLSDEGNLRVLQAPTFDPEKIGPKRFSLLLKGLIAGLFVGLVLAMLRQRFVRRLMDPDTFERAQGMPVLGVVPDMPSLRRFARRQAWRKVVARWT